MTEIAAAIISGSLVWASMMARKNSEIKQEIFLRLNALEKTVVVLEERCPMKPSR